MLASILTLVLATAAFAMPANIAARAPDPSQVYINNIVYGGSGCPQGSVGSYISPDRQTFTLIFDQYVASIGPGVAVAQSRKNCQLNLDLKYPGGFQYSILNTVYRGYAALDAGVTGVQATTFYFSGQTAQSTTSSTFKGPSNGDYATSDAVDLTSTIWSPCGANSALNMNSQIRLASSNNNARGLITDDSIDGKITFVVGVQWQKC